MLNISKIYMKAIKLQKNRVQKLITFSPNLYTIVERKAEKIGISFPEYIRMLAVSDIKEEVEELPMVDEETEAQIGKSLKDLKEGRYTDIRTEKELDTHLKSL
jgi:Holliday junction resolvase